LKYNGLIKILAGWLIFLQILIFEKNVLTKDPARRILYASEAAADIRMASVSAKVSVFSSR